MKEYIKPELNVKSLLQETTIANQWVDEEGNVAVSAPNAWWPDYAE